MRSTRKRKSKRLSKARLDELVEEAIVDCYNESEQATRLCTMIEDELALPFETTVLGVRVMAKERPGAAASEPLVRYWWYGGEKKSRRMSGQRAWKIIKDLGKRVGVDTIYPHAFRHACGVELLKRSGGNLRAVQEHSASRRHPDDDDLHAAGTAGSAEGREPVRPERRWGAVGIAVRCGAGRKTFAENVKGIELVAPTGFEPVLEARMHRRVVALWN